MAVIRSVAGLDVPDAERLGPPLPWRRTTRRRYAAMVGGGPHLRPGLVTQAHHGVLFLDELAEFDRDVLDALRQPLEDGTVEIVRAHGSVRYPARLQLIAAMNPCRCGWHGDPARACRCPIREPERYMRRVSGPLLDRIDLRVVMPRMEADELVGAGDAEGNDAVAARIVPGLAPQPRPERGSRQQSAARSPAPGRLRHGPPDQGRSCWKWRAGSSSPHGASIG